MANTTITSEITGGYYNVREEDGDWMYNDVQTLGDDMYLGYRNSKYYESAIEFKIADLKNKNISITEVKLEMYHSGGATSYSGANFDLTTARSFEVSADDISLGTYTLVVNEKKVIITFSNPKNFLNYLKTKDSFYIRITCSDLSEKTPYIRFAGYQDDEYPSPKLTITYSENQNFIYYGVNGSWVPCEVYYGTGGSWQQVVPHYGTGGSWQQLGG